jgi:hypothetical protein
MSTRRNPQRIADEQREYEGARERRRHEEDLLDEALQETFPASDPISIPKSTADSPVAKDSVSENPPAPHSALLPNADERELDSLTKEDRTGIAHVAGVWIALSVVAIVLLLIAFVFGR